MEVSQPIVSNVVKYVTGKIIDKAPLWIHFPGALRLTASNYEYQNKQLLEAKAFTSKQMLMLSSKCFEAFAYFY
jgi:hypothetical protein